MECPFCYPKLDEDESIVYSNEYCLFLQKPQPVLVGSGLIIPKAHRETVFDLTPQEWQATFDLLHQVKGYIEKTYKSQGFNVGWNCGHVGGQEIFHAHLHVIPRFEDEPLAGKGLRYWLKQPNNKRIGV
ncbi:HIT family protein [Paenibacillus sp. GP183]|uniref:HIT family protein n=1 Tax=Paenibacillus sp. GP183 TaxID=1882751 RepID=UPI000895B397|nr:HIT family protein [Paenibacillus sp. GP183]SEC58446.1 Diadenosine tetraphosphate (Ap4A) hydrolase [Paenibacillus sp. GP183]